MKVCRIKVLYLATKKIDTRKASTPVALEGSYPLEWKPPALAKQAYVQCAGIRMLIPTPWENVTFLGWFKHHLHLARQACNPVGWRILPVNAWNSPQIVTNDWKSRVV